MIAREEPFLKKRPLPRAPSRKDEGWGDSGGEARFSERSPSPPRPPSPEERLAFELAVSSKAGMPPESWVRIPAALVVVTAADRAAATLRRGGDGTPPPAYGGRLPFQGRLCREVRQRAPSAERVSSVMRVGA